MTWEVTGTTEEKVGDVAVVTKRLVGHVDNSKCPQIKVDIQLTLTTPADAKGPVPGDDGVRLRRGSARGRAGPRRRPRRRRPRQRRRVAVRGFRSAVATAGPRQGLGLCHHRPQQHPGRQRRGPDQGHHRPVQQGAAPQARRLGALRAWAWGASRALDYFETDKAVDAKQVGIEGLSRYGKAALVAMAYDQRFAIGFIGSSGEGGAKLHRRNFGELVENLTGSGEYHWMAGNFLKYGGPLTPGDLPVDAHELIALCAPRPTFISYGASTGPGCRGAVGRPAGKLHGGRGGRPGLQAAGQEGPGYLGIPRGGDGADRRRARLPAAQGGPHHRPELADVPGVRRPLHQGQGRPGDERRAISDAGVRPMTSRIPRPRPAGLLALALVALAGAGSRGEEGRWVGTWAASPQLTEPANMPPEPGLADATLRQIVHVSLGGKRLRVRFSNAFGAKPLTILSAHVATSAGGVRHQGRARQAAHVRRAGFGDDPAGGAHGLGPGRLRPGAALRPRGDDPRQGPDKRDHRPPGGPVHFVSAARGRVTDPELPQADRTPHWYYLCGVDVDDADAAAVAVLGDSITDGRGSPTDGNGRWTDHLARRLQEGEWTARVGVLNQGLGGNRVLNDGLGPNALARLDRDVLAQPGVRWLIVLEGINDLGTRSATAPDLIGAYEQIILRRTPGGIKVYGATIMPCEGSSYFNPALEADRQEVNAWVRDSGRFDAVIDFDAATRDPRKAHPPLGRGRRRRPPAPGPRGVQDHGGGGRPEAVSKITGLVIRQSHEPP